MPRPDDEGRPLAGPASNVVDTDIQMLPPNDIRDAELALRCAWLRGTAHQMDAVDPSGQLSAQLRDLADLIEVAQARGWWGS